MRDVGDVRDVRDVGDVRDVRDVGDVEDVRDARDVGDVRDVRDVGDVEDVRDARDVGDVRDVRDVRDVMSPDAGGLINLFGVTIQYLYIYTSYYCIDSHPPRTGFIRWTSKHLVVELRIN